MEEVLPGFRFHPTEEELLEFYLKQQHGKRKKKLDIVIPTVHLYRHEPWELPGMAPRIVDGREREWYFFVPRDDRRKQQRPSRTTERGFWKATGSDRAVRCAGDPDKRLIIGLKKTLVYYEGRAPRGTKTDWVMNEYRLPDSTSSPSPPSTCMVLCKIYRKAVSLKQMEQRVAMEEQQLVLASANADATRSSTTAGSTSSSTSDPQQQHQHQQVEMMKKEVVEQACVVARPATLRLPQLEIARPPSSSQPHHRLQEVESEWMMMQEDPFLTQLRSPWMEGWSSPPAYYF